MNNGIRLPGFPPPEKQDAVKFYILKSISYSTRMMLYLILIFLGFSIQTLMLSPWPGAIFLICATLLNLVRGFDSRARLKAFGVDSNWTEVDMDRIHQVEKLNDKITNWDRDILDISNASGEVMFVLTIVVLILGSAVLPFFIGKSVASVLITDIVILVLPLWFNGIRRVLKQGNLRIKIDIISKMAEYFQSLNKEGEAFKPALMLARDKSGKSIPTDARFTISFKDMPTDFYGIQAQININLIEGSSYPYFYCVIPAKVGFGLEKYIHKIYKSKNVIIEFQKDEKAEVIVIRQFTTKTSGYHTKINDCKDILELSLLAARTILE